MSSPQHEPTMEEILASIRKIISEDSPEAAAPAAEEPAAPAAAAKPELLTTPEPAATLDIDVLELTQEVVEPPAPQPEPNAMPEPIKPDEIVFEPVAQAAGPRRPQQTAFSPTRPARRWTTLSRPFPKSPRNPRPPRRRPRPHRADGRLDAWKMCSSAPCAKASSRCCRNISPTIPAR